MPELPEVETVRRGLVREVVGSRVTHVEVGRERVVRRTSRDELVARLSGATVTEATRRGKYLFLHLDNADRVMVHLRMSGRLLTGRPGEPRPPHTHVVLGLREPGGGEAELWFVDPRTFGEVVAYDPVNEDLVLPEIARLGPDPLVDGIDVARLRAILRSTSRPVKAALLDQHLVAGIGNIYGDEILHRARVSPIRPARDVNPSQGRRIHAALHTVLNEAVEAGGSTLRDAQYVDTTGSAGRFQERHRVYSRGGEPCLSCARGRVVSAVVGGRTTSWCRSCQR